MSLLLLWACAGGGTGGGAGGVVEEIDVGSHDEVEVLLEVDIAFEVGLEDSKLDRRIEVIVSDRRAVGEGEWSVDRKDRHEVGDAQVRVEEGLGETA
jgi:hypothetical protein